MCATLRCRPTGNSSRRATKAAADGRSRSGDWCSKRPAGLGTHQPRAAIGAASSGTRGSVSSITSSSSSPRPGRRRQATTTEGGGSEPATTPADANAAAADEDNREQRAAALDAATMLYTRAWSRGDIKLLDAIMAPDHVQNDAIWQPSDNNNVDNNSSNSSSERRAATAGRDRMKRGILAYRRAYPDVRFEVLDAVATRGEGDSIWRVFVHWRAGGTNLGAIGEAEPTGRRAEFSGVNVATVRVRREQRGADGEAAPASSLSAQLVRSDVYRQAPADEAAYFLSRGGGEALAGGSGGGGGGS